MYCSVNDMQSLQSLCHQYVHDFQLKIVKISESVMLVIGVYCMKQNIVNLQRCIKANM